MHPLTQEFMTLFEGHQNSYGTYNLTGEVTESGKHKGKAVSISRAITIEDYSSHLTGHCGLGVIPINAKSMAKFGAIDIDVYPLDLAELQSKVKKLNLPLTVCRTKSGGAHLYVFLTDWAPASVVQKKLREMSVVLGHGSCEIYPRQAQLLAERGDAGNWINLPYFDCHKTFRYALTESGEALPIEQFVKDSFKNAISSIALGQLKFTAPEALPGGPPCLQQLCASGFPDGTRNNGLLNLGVYAQKAYGDGWEGRLENMNNMFMKPPLPAEEVIGVIRSLKKKDYQYTCKAQPIESYCNAALCRTCVHGVGGAQIGMPKVGTLTKVNSVPPIWFCDVEMENGIGRLELTTDDLQNPLYFQRKALEQLNILPFLQKREVWNALIQKLLTDVTIVEVPQEATPIGQLFRHLETFLIDRRIEAKSKDELLLGKPWHYDGMIHFRVTDFLDYLQLKKFSHMPMNKIASYLKEIKGYDKVFHAIKGKGVNVITIPLSTFDSQKESFDIPKQPKEVL
jgi:hypothetical protein